MPECQSHRDSLEIFRQHPSAILNLKTYFASQRRDAMGSSGFLSDCWRKALAISSSVENDRKGCATVVLDRATKTRWCTEYRVRWSEGGRDVASQFSLMKSGSSGLLAAFIIPASHQTSAEQARQLECSSNLSPAHHIPQTSPTTPYISIPLVNVGDPLSTSAYLHALCTLFRFLTPACS
jgi:hypothetical protein